MSEATRATLTAGLPRWLAGRLPAPDLDGLESMALSGRRAVDERATSPNEHEQKASEACRG